MTVGELLLADRLFLGLDKLPGPLLHLLFQRRVQLLDILCMPALGEYPQARR
jgi:hypothetical protein